MDLKYSGLNDTSAYPWRRFIATFLTNECDISSAVMILSHFSHVIPEIKMRCLVDVFDDDDDDDDALAVVPFTNITFSAIFGCLVVTRKKIKIQTWMWH